MECCFITDLEDEDEDEDEDDQFFFFLVFQRGFGFELPLWGRKSSSAS